MVTCAESSTPTHEHVLRHASGHVFGHVLEHASGHVFGHMLRHAPGHVLGHVLRIAFGHVPTCAQACSGRSVCDMCLDM